MVAEWDMCTLSVIMSRVKRDAILFGDSGIEIALHVVD